MYITVIRRIPIPDTFVEDFRYITRYNDFSKCLMHERTIDGSVWVEKEDVTLRAVCINIFRGSVRAPLCIPRGFSCIPRERGRVIYSTGTCLKWYDNGYMCLFARFKSTL